MKFNLETLNLEISADLTENEGDYSTPIINLQASSRNGTANGGGKINRKNKMTDRNESILEARRSESLKFKHSFNNLTDNALNKYLEAKIVLIGMIGN